MKKTLDVFLRALCTGFAIGIGGAVYLSCDNKYLGAFLFGTGLFTILTFGFNLFTGKVGYAVEREPAYILELLIVWLGNFGGAAISAYMLLNTRISGIADKARAMCEIKLADDLLSIFSSHFSAEC